MGGRAPRANKFPMACCRGLRGCFEASVGVAGAATASSVLGCAVLGELAGFSGFAGVSIGRGWFRVSGAALGAVVSALPTTTRLVILPGRFVGISSFRLEVRTPIVAPRVDDAVRAGLRSGDCADDDWEDSEATADLLPFCATGVAFETPAVG